MHVRRSVLGPVGEERCEPTPAFREASVSSSLRRISTCLEQEAPACHAIKIC